MASLTFARPRPLAPPALNDKTSEIEGGSGYSTISPPMSPLNQSPPPILSTSDTAGMAANQASPASATQGAPKGKDDGVAVVPNPQPVSGVSKIAISSSITTPTASKRAQPQLARGPYHLFGVDTPGNTPVPPSHAQLSVSSHMPPSSLSTPLGSARPLNAALTAIRGRGSTGAAGAVGIGAGPGKAQDAPHAATPGNTPSSLERISRRMASNLMLSGDAPTGGSGANRIMPSYERRFNAGLHDVDFQSPPQTLTASDRPGRQRAFHESFTTTDWPLQFGDASEDGNKSPGARM